MRRCRGVRSGFRESRILSFVAEVIRHRNVTGVRQIFALIVFGDGIVLRGMAFFIVLL